MKFRQWLNLEETGAGAAPASDSGAGTTGDASTGSNGDSVGSDNAAEESERGTKSKDISGNRCCLGLFYPGMIRRRRKKKSKKGD